MTFISQDFEPVLDGVTAGTKKQIRILTKRVDLPGPKVNKFDYNGKNVKYGRYKDQGFGPKQGMVRFVLQGGTACSEHPCFGWIQSTGANIFGSIFSMSTDPNGHQTKWKGYPWDPSASDDEKEKGKGFNTVFERDQNSWLKNLEKVIQAVKEWKLTHTKTGEKRKFKKEDPDGKQANTQ